MIINVHGDKFENVSRWIKVEYVQVTNRNYEHANAVKDYENGEYIAGFKYKGKRYFMDDFLTLPYPYMWINEDIDVIDVIIGGYEYGNYHDPLYIEIHDNGEYIRLWKYVK